MKTTSSKKRPAPSVQEAWFKLVPIFDSCGLCLTWLDGDGVTLSMTELLERIRVEKQLFAADLAEQMGVSKRTVHGWFGGRNMSLAQAYKLEQLVNDPYALAFGPLFQYGEKNGDVIPALKKATARKAHQKGGKQ